MPVLGYVKRESSSSAGTCGICNVFFLYLSYVAYAWFLLDGDLLAALKSAIARLTYKIICKESVCAPFLAEKGEY